MRADRVEPLDPTRRWVERPEHRRWLRREADDLLRFFEAASLDPRGGFFSLDLSGRPDPRPEARAAACGVHVATRMTHCFSIATLMGRPGAAVFVDHGLAHIWEAHRDPRRGGYFWAATPDGPLDDAKQAYGHAFVLLAASSARLAGHPDADRLLNDVLSVILDRFWEERPGAVAEEFSADWSPLSAYRGQNSNMHMTEALMAAFEATGREECLRMAERIATLLIRERAAEAGWVVPEHFDAAWRIDRRYAGDPIFRPAGVTPGHAFEWVRLLMQLRALAGPRLEWPLDAARELFARAARDGWDHQAGGVFYTLDWNGRPAVKDRYWWPCCEAIAQRTRLPTTTGARRTRIGTAASGITSRSASSTVATAGGSRSWTMVGGRRPAPSSASRTSTTPSRPALFRSTPCGRASGR